MKRFLTWYGFSVLVAAVLFVVGIFILRSLASRTEKPLEAARIRAAEVEQQLPFQVVIPAYLPNRFDRASVEIHPDGAGPQGEPLVKLSYTDRYGNQLTLTEWVPAGRTAAATAAETKAAADAAAAARAAGEFVPAASSTRWISATSTQAVVQKGMLTIQVDLSTAQVLTAEQFKAVIDTLSAPTGMEVYRSLEQIPVEKRLPPAEEIPTGKDGVQEVLLVVTPEGYAPAHFAVRKGVPVRLIFKQYGEVGCGNELLLTWGKGSQDRADLVLASASDTKTLEFTPNQPGVFQVNCPHLFYIGAMTVK